MTTDIPTRPLLTVKQVIPPPSQGAMPRERLSSRLRLSDTRLTVVVAPAGWGKTSLLSGWAADPAEQRAIAWVSLDETDDEPGRFWNYVLTALHTGGAVSEAPLRALSAAQVAPVELALPILLNELATATGRYVLVLDDFHTLRDPRIHESVEFLLSYLPPALRLVLAGRSDPPLPLARLRARGELTELRAADLRFSSDEACELVSAVAGAPLEKSAAAAVYDRTEGWAAGLQLAGLALRLDPSRIGDDRHVLDYFTAEVLPSLEPRQRDLLVRAAPLELLSGPLCDAALGVTGSADVLEELVRADMFVAAQDGGREWYRCHRLLREALARDTTTDPAELLERAATWFAEHHRIDDAAEHLLRAGRDEAAGALLTRHCESWFFERGAAATYLRLGERVSRAATTPTMAISLASAAMLCGRQDRVIYWLDVCDADEAADATIEGWHSFRAASLRLRATFGLPEAESALSVEVARRAVELETADGNAGHPTVHTALGSALTRDGRFDEGVAILQRIWQTDRTGWRAWNVLQVAGSLAISLAETGRGAECDRVLRDVAALAASVERDGRAAAIPGLSSLRTATGRRRYQQGDAEDAVALLRHGVAYAELHPRPLILVMALIYLADAELACGRRPEAQAALVRAREVTDDDPVSAFAMRRLADAETRLGRRAARTAVRAGVLHEELTDRELSVLRALQGSASQREIGAALFLSINTVKAYAKSLYRKLGVASRHDAVAAGRAHGLI